MKPIYLIESIIKIVISAMIIFRVIGFIVLIAINNFVVGIVYLKK
jgi:hypothetical protein